MPRPSVMISDLLEPHVYASLVQFRSRARFRLNSLHLL
jgi:hypothetical protein